MTLNKYLEQQHPSTRGDLGLMEKIAQAYTQYEATGWERGMREALAIVNNNAAYWERQGHFEARDAVWSATKELEIAIDARKAK